jgi:molecular chaperone GrpE (heat shock protein)
VSLRGWRNGAHDGADEDAFPDSPTPREEVVSAYDGDVETSYPEPVAGNDLGNVHEELAELRALFESRLRYDETREVQFSRLYEELESYKKAEASERMLGLARGVLLIVDQIEQGSATDATEIAEDLLDCLATEGIEPIHDVLAEPRSGLEQVVGFTDDGQRQILRCGYRFGDAILRPSQVLAPRSQDVRSR